MDPELSSNASPVTLATSPHLGQALAPPSKEKKQPQKHATSAITGTFFLCVFSARAATWPTGEGRRTGALFIVTGRVLVVLIQQRRHRLPDRYVWVSGFVALGHLEIAASQQRELVMPLARRLCKDGLRADLPEFTAWALVYQAEAGDLAKLPLVRTLAAGIVNPALQARVAAL